MKKSIYFAAFALLSVMFVFSSCNRYDEGANFSLLTAKARLVNTWTMASSSYESGGNTTTNTGFSEVIVIFSKDNSYSYTGKYLGFPFSEAGNWAFNSDKTSVIMTEDNGDVETWKLIKLKNKELKVSTPLNNGTLTFEFTGE